MCLGKLSGNSGELRDAFDDVRLRDFKDQQAELSGVETGRMARFTDEDTRGSRTGKTSKRERAAERLSRLQQLLATNPGYAKLYNDTMDALGKAERAVEQALERAKTALRKAKAALEDTMDRAAQLPNGTKVFRDDEGQVWTEHGQRVDDEEAQSIVWRAGAPGRQELLENRDSAGGRVTDVEALQRIQVDLGDARNRLQDDDKPPLESDLRQTRKTIDQAMTLSNNFEQTAFDDQKPSSTTPSANLEIPQL